MYLTVIMWNDDVTFSMVTDKQRDRHTGKKKDGETDRLTD